MIDYAPSARLHVRQLAEYYRAKQRPEALQNLRAALISAEAAIKNRSPHVRSFPAVYRNLSRPGRAWIKEGIYWIAYNQTDPPVIVAVFWESADFGSRYPDVP